MNKSEKLDQLALNLCKVQASLKGALKDSKNPFFNSKYADLESVWDSCRKELTDAGFSVIQTMGSCEMGTTLVTTLLHSSGQWIEGSQPVLAAPKKSGQEISPQDLGSAITYARRYGLAAIVGVIQVDDDAEGAMRRSNAGPGAVVAIQAAPSADNSIPGAYVIKLGKKFLGQRLDAIDVYELNSFAEYLRKGTPSPIGTETFNAIERFLATRDTSTKVKA